MKSKYKELKEKGICYSCRRNKIGEHSICDECFNKQKTIRTVRKLRLKNLGLCTRCGKEKVQNGIIICEKCKIIHREEAKRSRFKLTVEKVGM